LICCKISERNLTGSSRAIAVLLFQRAHTETDDDGVEISDNCFAAAAAAAALAAADLDGFLQVGRTDRQRREQKRNRARKGDQKQVTNKLNCS
jgi:hypothetical protein